MRRNTGFYLILFLQLILTCVISAQGKLYEGPDDPAGDIGVRKDGYMSGNRVFLYFKNTTELSKCCGTQYSKWPNDHTGQAMTDGVALILGSKVKIKNDSIPDPWSTDPNIDTLYFVQTSYREGMDRSLAGDVVYGFEPVRGYLNDDNEYVAMSNIPTSWPANGWPASGNQLIWPGYWNGRFGKGIVYADLETYFVANDAQDLEYIQPSSRLKYFPRPGVKIGDKNPDITSQFGKPWGGLGLRVETRGMQWNNPQTQDAIFWEYSIANISEYDLPETAFGFWIDNGIGSNEPTDDLGYFDDYLDLAFSWDIDMIGEKGEQPGIMGFAFLESPGISDDGIDNDDDGIIDEKRDNTAVAFYDNPTEGIYDIEKYKRAYGEPKPHWDADEDGDWLDGNDENGDGVYQKEEFYGDDLGTDGVGPLDLHYDGPDANGTECNHKPDFIDGFGSEPNFAVTDVSESDMIGLTTFVMFGVPETDGPWFYNDDVCLKLMSSGRKESFSGDIENLVEFFAASPFPLYKGRTERISMSILHSYDYITYGNIEPEVPSLSRKKEVVQVIYERDYRFATPPLMPTLTATAGDGKVILSWNNVADKFSKEPLLQNINDFEGYKLYKATDKNFKDPEVITNGFGEATLKKPIYQCDIVNNKKGFTDFGLVDGMAYYLGNDTGIEHFYIDEDVKNGETYYYALVAYDYGVKNVGEGITPYENSTILDLDEYGSIRNTGINVAIMKPTPMAAGYVPPAIKMETEIEEDNTLHGNPIKVELLDHVNAKPGNKYKVLFHSTEVASLNYLDRRSAYDMKFATSGIEVFNITDGNEFRLFLENSDSTNNKRDLLVEQKYDGSPEQHYIYPIGKEVVTSIFDGIQFAFTPSVASPGIVVEKTGWVVGDSPIKITPSYSQSTFFPWEYEIVFTDNTEETTTQINYTRYLKGTDEKTIVASKLLTDQSFNFYVANKSFENEDGTNPRCDLLLHDVDGNGDFNKDVDEILVGHYVIDGAKIRWGGTIFSISFADVEDSEMPGSNDVYRVVFNSLLSERDSIIFTIDPAIEVVKEDLNEKMDDIKVVPNPYIATNSMEPALQINGMNQQRRLLFTNIPAACKIKIFTMSGVFVDEIIVENSSDRGSVHWDMLTREGLEIASGIYIYQVKSDVTGEEKIGKFAVLK
ncbi:MAG: hypothetical protein JEY94_13390 [Melioribacteraceae bacterium]|nr:hypothetical protein [Melioribacteraceae bacterium]